MYISVTGTSGTFYSANYPSTYPDNYEEEYNISVEEGSRISLLFQYFDIEYHAASCFYDHIKGKFGIMDAVCNIWVDFPFIIS